MTILYELFGKVLYYIYEFIGDYGLAIVIFSILAKLLLLPINIKQTKSLQATSKVQPEVQKLQKKYKDKPEKLNEEMMKLYKEHNINPMGGCLPLLIQFPIIIGLYRVLQQPQNYVFESQAVYDAIDKAFLWLPNLAQPDPLHILPIVAALTTYLYMSNNPTSSAGNEQAEQMTKSMKFISPLLIGFMAWTFPSGLAVYWVIQNIFTFVQQHFMKSRSAQEGGK